MFTVSREILTIVTLQQDTLKSKARVQLRMSLPFLRLCLRTVLFHHSRHVYGDIRIGREREREQSAMDVASRAEIANQVRI